VDVRDFNGCWIWIGGRIATGYGHLYVNGKMQYTHRLAWEYLVGPIPDGYVIDHDHPVKGCGNTYCCNPDHLQAVPEPVNLWRRRGSYKNSTSGERGIRWDAPRQKWIVEVQRDRQRQRRRFTDLDQARAWRDAVHNEINMRDEAG